MQELFNRQKGYFDTDATKSYEWRVDQLDRVIRMLKDNFKRFSDAVGQDFKTASRSLSMRMRQLASEFSVAPAAVRA